LLIDIAEHLRDQSLDFKIVIAGTGELEQQLRHEIAAHNLEQQITLLGFVEDIRPFMQDIDIFALTSLWEGFGYVLVEAMIYAKPVVAFNVSSNPEIVSADKTGYLVERGNTAAFAEKLALLISDSKKRDSMGTNGRETVRARFDLKIIIDQLERYMNSGL